ncbi:MAG: hypothetical protein QS748_08725 [Candidatus Endonucleobacter bathymodioli]|uniref:Uncharacterized protein n=1 Tax=Candidatus Endonucleibacter bathymodioli TaxID=539814 RepID=A0AA90NM41_9GAMM|nr:hypothetical protein [Candidatus Endonucleobacter bathymodioli]
MNKDVFIDTSMNGKTIDGLLVTATIIRNMPTSFMFFIGFQPLSLPEVDCSASIGVASMVLMGTSPMTMSWL